MKNGLKLILVTVAVIMAVAVILVLSGCEKSPSQEISDAKKEIEGIETGDGPVYAAEELRQVKEDLEAALDEVKTQDEKLMIKKYDKAKEMLSKVKVDAENLKMAIPKRKEEVRNNALAILSETKTKIDEANSLLATAPTGKGTQADIEAFKEDLKGLEGSLGEIQQSIDAEKYFAAIDNAKIVRDKADSIAQQIRNALEKVHVRT